jgi:hypothetical protein
MKMLNRRMVILGGVLQIVSIPSAFCQDRYFGCLISNQQTQSQLRGATQFGYSSDATMGSSGDKNLDLALAHSLAYLSDSFSVLPGFAFLDDVSGPNAYASLSNALGRADGSVMLGIRLLNKLLQEPEAPDAQIAAVCAHEFGHICQFKHNVISILEKGYRTAKRVELHADYLAGAFAGLRRLQKSDFPAAVVALAQFNVGDHQKDHPDHHGTPEERGQAVVQGYKATFERREDFITTFWKGVEYARYIP